MNDGENENENIVTNQMENEVTYIQQNHTDMVIPLKVTDLVPGQTVAGIVHKVEEFGILIKFFGTHDFISFYII